MKIHIFNDFFHAEQNLQSVASGMFPIYGEKGIIANIISKNGDWLIRLSKNYTFTKNKETENQEKPEENEDTPLQEYNIYAINSKTTDEHYYIIFTPKFFRNAKKYAIPNEITIGNDQSCDILYNPGISQSETLKLSKKETYYQAVTNSSSFFTQNSRIKNGQNVYIGDYILFYGLKIVILPDKIIICTPENQYAIKSSNIKLIESEKLPAINSIRRDKIEEDKPLYGEKDYLQKSPRLNYIIEEATVDIDEPPAGERKNEQSLFLTLAPQVTMALTSGLSMMSIIVMMSSGNTGSYGVRMVFSIITMSVTLISALLWPTISRRMAKKKAIKNEQKRQKKYREYLAHKEQHLNFIRESQRQTLLANNPSPSQCFKIAKEHSLSLWQRNNSYDDFLNVRLGLGTIKTKLKIQEPKEKFSLEEDDSLFLLYKQVIKKSKEIEGAPVCYDLTKQPISAIAGNSDTIKEFIDCIFAQIFTFHSYTDLKIVVFTKEPSKWNYLKILPHCWANDRTKRYFATTLENFNNATIDIEKIFDARKANDEEVIEEDDGGEKTGGRTSFRDFHPYYLFFTDNIADLRTNQLVKKILEYKRNLGFSILTTANAITMLPSETKSFISIASDKGIVISGNNEDKEQLFTPDLNNNQIDMQLFAKQLANIPIQIEKGKFELPKSLPFLELYNCGRVEQLNSLARWNENIPYESLAVPIGIDQNNEKFKMDIHEKAYGPHGLIAGTTGSGKSEWIVTYILSLAVNFSPKEVQFVLIDYKGGGLAKSFENEELGIKLPHLAGTITNLDKSDIFRSIAAIESELKRRQSLFNEAREKLKRGTMDIYSYQECYRNGEVNIPLSHLLIICDEFAELKHQEPEFMDQLISTSRIGRSLGVHLILATQKPSGIVNEQIWSNSKFKVALKVQNQSDSREILKSPEAAYLKQTGSFYLQVGNNDYFNLGQSAWAGAKYYPSDTIKKNIDDSVQLINEIGIVTDTLQEDDEEIKGEAQGEQLLNIVQYLSEIGEDAAKETTQLWLENIAPTIYFSDIYKKYNRQRPQPYTYETVIGEYDEPRRQEQNLLQIDLSGGNIAIVGKADSSIENLLSMIVWSSVVEHNPAEIAFYILDFGTETLKKFKNFPHVGEVILNNESDKIAGIINLIADEIEYRKKITTDYNGSFSYYNKHAKEKLNLIVIIINNYDIFGETFPKAINYFTDFFRDAPKYGIIFILSANTQSAIGSRLQQYFNHMILMQLSDDSLYRGITNCRRGLIPKKITGRGICKIDSTNPDSYCEFQTASIDEEEKELETIKNYAKTCNDYYKYKVKQLFRVPDNISSADLENYLTTLSETPIAIDLQKRQLVNFDFQNQKIHLITGKHIAEDINFIYALATILSKMQGIKVHIVDMLGIFRKPILDIQILEQDKNAVFEALAKDVASRKESQGTGITIVLGAGLFKQQLNQAGIDAYRKIFEKLPNSERNIYILVDNYESMRNLILEDWFKQADKTTGIWIGEGLDSQSLFDCAPLSTEDANYSFEGLAYILKNGEFTIAKVVMDEDK